MGILDRLFGFRDRDQPVGEEATKLVIGFLESTDGYRLSAHTFTELFAFAFIEMDCTLFARGVHARAEIADSMRQAFVNVLRVRFSDCDQTLYEGKFDELLDDYGAVLRSGEDTDAMLEQLDIMLSPLADRLSLGLMGMLQSKMALREFYTGTLAPFIMQTVIRWQ